MVGLPTVVGSETDAEAVSLSIGLVVLAVVGGRMALQAYTVGLGRLIVACCRLLDTKVAVVVCLRAVPVVRYVSTSVRNSPMVQLWTTFVSR